MDDKVKYWLELSDYDLESVYLFGSFASDTSREDSDIDVAVVVNNISGDYFAVNPLLW